jgi:hypothetical protein
MVIQENTIIHVETWSGKISDVITDTPQRHASADYLSTT